jgi:hemolysin activation/secretion protein
MKKSLKTSIRFQNYYIRIIFVVASFLFSFSALAQSQSGIDQQDWITRNQQNILEEKKRNTEFEAIKKERERKKKQEADDEQKQKLKVLGKPAQCFEIKEIRLLEANLISARQQKKLVAPFLGKCFESPVLLELVAAVNAYYQGKGYVTTQVLVPKQNVQSGILELKIIEGKIEKISLGKDRLVEKMQEFTAFGAVEGDVLNINHINQGIYQINRLSSNAAVMKISPGSADGQSVVTIDNNKKFPVHLTIGQDNLGNDFTGVRRSNFSAGLDNLLFLNDNINLSYTTNLKDSGALKDSTSFSGGISVPFGYNTLTFDYYKSEFLGTIVGNSVKKSTGFSSQKKFGLDRVLSNTTNFRLAANSALTIKETASYLDDVKSETSQRKLVIANLAFSASYYFNDTTNIYLKPSYSKGLKILNAKQDQKNVSVSTPKAQFEVFKLYASLSKRLTIPKINTPLTLTTEMDSQFGKSTLFGSEQVSVGGYYSVRGFRENYITGDSGYNFRNKVGFNLGSVLFPLFAKKADGKNTPQTSENFFSNNLRHLSKFRIEPFYDYGFAQNKYDNSSGRMSGAGIKTIFDSRYFNAAVTYSQALQKSKLITSTVKENKMVYFEVSASCC